MYLYPLIPLTACGVCAAIASILLARDASQPANRLAAALVGCGGVWAGFELLWSVQPDPDVALQLVRASALGWVWLGPLTLHLFAELAFEPLPRVRRALPWAYATSAAFLALDWFTPWFHTAVTPAPWGWAYAFGPAYPPFYAFTAGSMATALAIAWRARGRARSAGERQQLRWLGFGMLVPLCVASTTDGMLPLAGVAWPRFGALSIAALGAALLWPLRRFGSVLLAPRSFTAEILDTLPDGVATLGLDGCIRGANARLAQLLEASPDRLAGLRLTERLSEPVHPTDEPREHRCEVQTLTGRARPVAISSRVLNDRAGSEIGLVLVMRDLGEVVALRDRLLLSGRLAAVGELAAGVAHEINNPLAFVRSNLGLLREHWAGLVDVVEKAGAAERAGRLITEGEELVEESLQGVDRAAAIVRDVRGLARAGDGQRRAVDLNELLRGVLRMAAPQLRGRAEVEQRLGDVPFVWGAPPELQQVFLNLVINAAQALEGGGRVAVSSVHEGRFVVASVEDDGRGIDPEHRERIFDPFFTTKPVGEGSGLGLGIAHGIVQSHGGDIDVDTQPGVGTCFRVHLPVATDTLDDG